MAGAPRTTMSLMATATSSAVRQVTYSMRSGSSRWSRSSTRSPCQRMGSTLDDTLVASVHRDLRRRGAGEQRAAQLRGELGHVARCHLGLEQVLPFVLVDG